jgi:hypothetical protein
MTFRFCLSGISCPILVSEQRSLKVVALLFAILCGNMLAQDSDGAVKTKIVAFEKAWN